MQNNICKIRNNLKELGKAGYQLSAISSNKLKNNRNDINVIYCNINN